MHPDDYLEKRIRLRSVMKIQRKEEQGSGAVRYTSPLIIGRGA